MPLPAIDVKKQFTIECTVKPLMHTAIDVVILWLNGWIMKEMMLHRYLVDTMNTELWWLMQVPKCNQIDTRVCPFSSFLFVSFLPLRMLSHSPEKLVHVYMEIFVWRHFDVNCKLASVLDLICSVCEISDSSTWASRRDKFS